MVRPKDVDGDGDLDLFVGGRLDAGRYGVPGESFLLENDGRGKFTAPASGLLRAFGMVTDAEWLDGEPRLIVAQEWGPLLQLTFTNGAVAGIDTLPAGQGLWRTLELADVDGDGRQDIIAGNYGLNNLLSGPAAKPTLDPASTPPTRDRAPLIELHVNDFDGNGRAEQLLVRYDTAGRRYPLAQRDDLVKQLPGIRKVTSGYTDYARRSLEELFPTDVLRRSVVLPVNELRSVVLLNKAGGWEVRPLPTEAQLAPLYAVAVADINDDGHPDLLTGGNQTVAKPELGIYAADFGNLLLGDGAGNFRAVDLTSSGLLLSGDVRKIAAAGPNRWLVGRSNGPVLELQRTN